MTSKKKSLVDVNNIEQIHALSNHADNVEKHENVRCNSKQSKSKKKLVLGSTVNHLHFQEL